MPLKDTHFPSLFQIERKPAQICVQTEPRKLYNYCIWEGLRRLLVEIKGRRLSEKLTEKHSYCVSLRTLFARKSEQRETQSAIGVEKFCGVDSKSNKQDLVATQGNSIQTTLLSISHLEFNKFALRDIAQRELSK